MSDLLVMSFVHPSDDLWYIFLISINPILYLFYYASQ